MNDFEKQYYEAEKFWEGEMLQDEANAERIRKTADLVPADVKNLVDIGCGNGVFVNYLQKHKPGIDILGIDRSNTALKYVQTKKEVGDISDLTYGDRTFDCVTCLEVIEHLPVTVFESALRNLARISNKYLVISVPYNERLEESYNQCPSCKTIFNYQLHLRSFSDKKFQHLFDSYGFTCITTQKSGASQHYRGHYLFRKIFYKEQFKAWQSPICPICGYSEHINNNKIVSSESAIQTVQNPQRKKLISYFTGLPKLIWPKETKYYWIMGLYKRNT